MSGCRTSFGSKRARSGWSSISCRWSGCRRSKAISNACLSRSTAKAWSIRKPACFRATRSGAKSIARFTFEGIDRRASIDAARLFSRLVRDVDFACREQDGVIETAFTETVLRSAHVVARRLASMLKHTMLSPGDRGSIKPTVTLATLKPTDDLATLVARVGTSPEVAADRRQA